MNSQLHQSLIIPEQGLGYTIYCDLSRDELGCVLTSIEDTQEELPDLRLGACGFA